MRSALRLFSALALSVLALPVASTAAEDWGRFRGPNGSGISTTAAVPSSFDESGLLWSAEVPFGRSSPAIGGALIFLTAVEGEAMTTLAVNRKTGKVVWRKSIERARQAKVHRATDSSTPTPVTDGSNVYVFFQEFGLASYDAEGNERWRLPLGPFRNFYGMSSSPILANGTLVQVCDQGGGSFLLGVNPETGEEVWRTSRAGRRENYSTPVLYPSATDPRLLLVFGSKYLDAYDPATGKEVWTLPGLAAGPVASPVIDGNRIYAAGPDHAEEPLPPYASILEKHDANGDGHLVEAELEGTWMASNFDWIDWDADGNLTDEDWSNLNSEIEAEWGLFAIEITDVEKAPTIAWNYRKNVSYIPSLLVYDGVVYMVEESFLTSLDPETGEVLKKGRLKTGKTYASPVAGGGKVMFSQLEGDVSVVSAGGEWEVVSEHDFDEAIHGTPALTDGVLYLRTKGKLLAYEAAPEESSGEMAGGS